MSFPVWPIVNKAAINMYRFLNEHKFSFLWISVSKALLGHRCVCVCACARSVVSDSVTHGLYPAGLLCL